MINKVCFITLMVSVSLSELHINRNELSEWDNNDNFSVFSYCCCSGSPHNAMHFPDYRRCTYPSCWKLVFLSLPQSDGAGSTMSASAPCSFLVFNTTTAYMLAFWLEYLISIHHHKTGTKYLSPDENGYISYNNYSCRLSPCYNLSLTEK